MRCSDSTSVIVIVATDGLGLVQPKAAASEIDLNSGEHHLLMDDGTKSPCRSISWQISAERTYIPLKYLKICGVT